MKTLKIFIGCFLIFLLSCEKGFSQEIEMIDAGLIKGYVGPSFGLHKNDLTIYVRDHLNFNVGEKKIRETYVVVVKLHIDTTGNIEEVKPVSETTAGNKPLQEEAIRIFKKMQGWHAATCVENKKKVPCKSSLSLRIHFNKKYYDDLIHNNKSMIKN